MNLSEPQFAYPRVPAQERPAVVVLKLRYQVQSRVLVV